MKTKRNDRKHVMREISRKLLHLIVGTTGTVLAYFGVITGIHILLFTGLFTIIALFHKRYEFRPIEKILSKLDRKDIIPGFGAIMLGLGIGLAYIIFPRDIAFIAGICVSLVDGVSTIIATLQEKKTGKRNSFATLVGSIAAFAVLSSTLTHIPISVIIIGVLVAAGIDSWYSRIWIIDDNLLMPILVGTISFVALIIVNLL